MCFLAPGSPVHHGGSVCRAHSKKYFLYSRIMDVQYVEHTPKNASFIHAFEQHFTNI